MAELNINLSASIYAKIVIDSLVVRPNTPIILDPITDSYTDYPDANLISYSLDIIEREGITNTVLLENGKNSRFTSDGQGSCRIKLTIEDNLGNTATDEITLYIQ